MMGWCMLTIILGKTCAGKDQIVKKLVSNHGYHKLVTYTTRPMRFGEQQDKTYHFISEQEFQEKISHNFFMEYKSYNTAEGIWYYGSAKEDYEKSDSKTVIILTPEGYRDFLKKLPHTKHVSIYIYANNKTIKNRLMKRGDKKEEANRRLLHDNEDFKGVEQLVNKIFYNNETNQLTDVVNNIVEYLEEQN